MKKTFKQILTEVSERDGSKPMKEKKRLAQIEYDNSTPTKNNNH